MAEGESRVHIGRDLLVLRVTEDDDAGVTLCVGGEVDMANATELDAALRALIGNGHHSVRCDLCDVDYIDSSGIRVLLLAAARVERDGRQFEVTCVDGPVSRVLTICDAPHRVVAM
jgi:anti-anti-sigma factor